MKYIYLLLLILVLYYLFKNMYQKYSNQENFDPSLVPVSSIVTLAKVAQKLVDGGGTLTNPGNLQIGMPSAGANGNLYVTGTNTVDGNTTINGTTTINSLLTANAGISTTTIGATDNIAANSFSTTNGNVSINNGSINLTSDGTGGLYFLKSGSPGAPVYNRLYMGNTNITGDLSASGNTTVNGTLTVNNTTTLKNHISFVPPSSSTNQSYTLYTAGDNATGGVVSNSLDMHTYQNGGWRTHALSVGNDGNVSLYNNLNVSGVITSGHTYVKCFTVNSGPMNTNKYIYDGAPLKEGITYLVEAHVSYLHTGGGFDGIRAYFDNAIGPEWQMSYISGHYNNVLDLGGSAQSGVGGTAQRSSAVAVIYGPNIKLAIYTGTDDSYNLSVCLIAKPCNTF
jgi:hypothetical protein